MPAELLNLRLLEKCQGRVARSDLGWASKPASVISSRTSGRFAFFYKYQVYCDRSEKNGIVTLRLITLPREERPNQILEVKIAMAKKSTESKVVYEVRQILQQAGGRINVSLLQSMIKSVMSSQTTVMRALNRIIAQAASGEGDFQLINLDGIDYLAFSSAANEMLTKAVREAASLKSTEELATSNEDFTGEVRNVMKAILRMSAGGCKRLYDLKKEVGLRFPGQEDSAELTCYYLAYNDPPHFLTGDSAPITTCLVRAV